MKKIISASVMVFITGIAVTFITAVFIAFLFKYLFPSCEEGEVCFYFRIFAIMFGGALAGLRFRNKLP